MDNEKLGYEIIYVDHTSVELAITPIGKKWYLEVYKYGNGTKWLHDSYLMNKQCHKDIADLIGMSWSYYEQCLHENHPILLITNVNHWFRVGSQVLRLLYALHVNKDGTKIEFVLKEKI